MFTVLTWNLNIGLEGSAEIPEVLRRIDADLVLLQEVGDASLNDLWGLDYEHKQLIVGGAEGLAILSKFPMGASTTTYSPVGWFPAQRVTVETPGGPVDVLNVHLVPPFTDRGSLLLGWWTRHGDRLEELQHHVGEDVPDLVAGDFNTNERGRAMRWLARQGVETTLPPGEKTWKWPWLPAWRLDHVAIGPCLEANSAQVLDEGRSDHRPVLVTLQFVDAEPGTSCDTASP